MKEYTMGHTSVCVSPGDWWCLCGMVFLGNTRTEARRRIKDHQAELNETNRPAQIEQARLNGLLDLEPEEL